MDRQHLPTFYAGALQQGLRFVKLKPRTKESVGSWESSILPSVPAILASLDQGFNVGFLLQSKDMSNPNPLGVWGLDIDTQEAATRFPDAPFNLSVSRGHAFKRHYFALLPDPAAPRHSRNIRKSHDVKLTGILVAPGSTHQEGGIYSPEIRDPSTGLWVPWDGSPIDWASLSVVDPSPYMPLMTRLLPLSNKAAEKAAQSVSGEWVFASNQDASKWEDRPFSQAKGTLKDRTYRGESYVRNRLQCGIVSKSGDGGRATLLVIVTHLLQYLMLPDDVVMDLLVKPVHGTKKDWNSHCIDARTKALPGVN